MQKFNFDVNYLEVNRITLNVTNRGNIPFSAIANTYEECRSKALEFAQSIARCYNDNRETAFYFRICTR